MTGSWLGEMLTRRAAKRALQSEPAAENDEDEVCCFCLDAIPRFPTFQVRMACCGKMICIFCNDKWDDGDVSFDGCPYCRASLPSDEERLSLLTGHAEKGRAWAMLVLGSYYKTGYTVDLDMEQAMKWFAMARDAGDPDGTWQLARCFQGGPGRAGKDEPKGFQLALEAAEAGVGSAQTDVAWCYVNGRGVETNLVEGMSWYAKASQQGCPTAMVTLGAMLYTHDMKGIEHEVNEDVLNEMPTSLALFGAAQGSIDEEKTSFASLLKDRVCAKICAFCFAPSPPGPWCEQCEAAKYCSESCRANDSTRHSQHACNHRNRFLPPQEVIESRKKLFQLVSGQASTSS